MKRDVQIILGICVAAIVIGGALFFTDSSALPLSSGGTSFRVLAEGDTAVSMTERKNYRVSNEEQYETAWRRAYGENGPSRPAINFEREEILAVFDGEHGSGGYDIAVSSVVDTDAARTVTIVHTVPDESCMTTQAITSPFELVVVRTSALPITRIDETVVTPCE